MSSGKTVTPAMVKELREKTGSPMMDCKNALEASAGNIEGAIDWLRKKGMASAAKKESRKSADGLVRLLLECINRGRFLECNVCCQFRNCSYIAHDQRSFVYTRLWITIILASFVTFHCGLLNAHHFSIGNFPLAEVLFPSQVILPSLNFIAPICLIRLSRFWMRAAAAGRSLRCAYPRPVPCFHSCALRRLFLRLTRLSAPPAAQLGDGFRRPQPGTAACRAGPPPLPTERAARADGGGRRRFRSWRWTSAGCT